jgi:phosphoribosylanthranilate isomerase
MQNAKVKVCGIARLEDAVLAVELGAWAVGMVFYAASPRACPPDQAELIAAALKRRAELAGVFVNASLDEIARRCDQLGLTLVQLHGDEGPSFSAEVARRTGARVIKAGRVRSRADIQALSSFHTDFHLLDSYVADQPGGTGRAFAWELVAGRRSGVPLILSGGLTPDNVGAAVESVRPYAVDVASGVEAAPGRKDHLLMRDFAAAVAAANAVGTPS